jgi:hypothetical protein
MFLEQAAICYLNTSPPMPRKYAMHLILSGHRYIKSGRVFYNILIFRLIMDKEHI